MKIRPKKASQTVLADSLLAKFGEILNAEQVSDDLPKKWEKHGDLLLLPECCFTSEIWCKIDKAGLWQAVADHFGVTRVAKKGRICSDGHRSPQVVLVKGEDPWVTHVDNKIKYCYDVTKCMFSAGNITEKIRMAKLDCTGEVVVDMFAGIGYFTLPILVHAKARHVHACEWNPNAIHSLKRNLHENKVSDRCTVYEGDNRDVCPKGVGDRVVMGLIPNAMNSIEAACRSLRRGGVLHIHHNVESNVKRHEHTTRQGQTVSSPEENTYLLDCYETEPGFSCNKKRVLPAWVSWAYKTASTVTQVMRKIHEQSEDTCRFRTCILHIEKVKSYAPHVDHMVLDLRIDQHGQC